MAKRQRVDVEGLIADIHAEALEKGVARTSNTAALSTINIEQREVAISPSKGKRTGPPRPVSERQAILQKVWILVLGGRSLVDIVEIMEDEHGVAQRTTEHYHAKCRARLDAAADVRLADIWIRQVVRLEESALEARSIGKYEAQSMLEGVLMKVAGTGAPEKILHKHEHIVVDPRAVEIHQKLQAIQDASDGPRAIAHQVTDTGLADPRLGMVPSGTISSDSEHGSAIADRLKALDEKTVETSFHVEHGGAAGSDAEHGETTGARDGHGGQVQPGSEHHQEGLQAPRQAPQSPQAAPSDPPVTQRALRGRKNSTLAGAFGRKS